MRCGACGADNEPARERCAGCGEPLPPPPGPQPPAGGAETPTRQLPKAVLPGPMAAGRDRRTHERLEIPVGFRLQRLDASGAVLDEELVVAENISRGGARLKTTLPFRERDVAAVEEVGGGFRTRASVRRTYVGSDKVRRLNLQFLDRPAPERLVGAGAAAGSADLRQRLARILADSGEEPKKE